MFFVYGTSGQLFRGTMEQLRQIRGVGSLARSPRVAPTGRDGREPIEEPGAVFTTPGHDESHHPDRLQVYAKTQTAASQRRPLSRVADVMATRAITLPDSATVLQAWQVLTDHTLGQAPVVDDNGKLVGMLLRDDLFQPGLLAAPDQAKAWHALMQHNVKSIMWTPVPSVAPESDIRRVARVLLDTGLPGLPVVDESGQVCGFVARSDILRAVVNDPPLDLWG